MQAPEHPKLSLLDPPKPKKNGAFAGLQDKIIGPKRLLELTLRVLEVTKEEHDYRLRNMLVPELYMYLQGVCSRHMTLLQQSAILTDGDFMVLDHFGFVRLPARLQAGTKQP